MKSLLNNVFLNNQKIQLVIFSKNKSFLINILKNNNIYLYKIKNTHEENDSFEVIIKNKDLQKIKYFCKKYNCEIINTKNYKNKKLKLNKIKKYLLIFILLSVGLIYYLSLYIWNINIYGNYNYSEKEVIKVLSEHSVYPSVFKSKIDCENVKDILRKEFPEITWVSANINGTVLEINIKENFDSEIAIKSKEPYDIISNKKGTITKIITRSGTPLVVKGDEVEKGDILVSGIVYRYNDALEPISYELVNSDADIYASVEYDYSYEFDLSKIEKNYTGNKNNKNYIGIRNKRIIFGKNIKYENSTTITKESQLKLLSNFYLPVYYGTITDMQFYPKKQKISKTDAKKISKEKYDLYIKSLNQKSIVIISDDFSITFENNKCIAKSKLIVEEQIGTIKEVDKSNLSIINTDDITNDSIN